MIKWMVVVFFMCGEPAGFITNNVDLKNVYQGSPTTGVVPKIEELDIIRVDIEKISGLRCA